MNSHRCSRGIALALTVTAGLLLALSLKLPLWHMRMEAPQYRDEEALRVVVYPNVMRGDLPELRTLNQYIGVHIPEQLPQLRWLPDVLLAAGVLGFMASFLPMTLRRRALVLIPAFLTAALLVGAAQAQWQMYNVGHRRDAKPKLVGVDNFTPLIFGRVRVAQFEVSSWFGLGAYCIAAGMALQLGAAWLSRSPRRSTVNAAAMEAHAAHHTVEEALT